MPDHREPDVPTHPDRIDPSTDTSAPTHRTWRNIALIATVVIVVLVLLALHLSGVVGPGAH